MARALQTPERPAGDPQPATPKRSKRVKRDPEFDVALGARIRALRIDAGMSQTALGTAAGVSPQQIQKYEQGRDRLSAAMLFAIATALNVPIGSLYGGEADHQAAKAGAPTMRVRSGAGDNSSTRIVVLFQQITDPGIHKHLVALATALAKGQARGEPEIADGDEP